VIAALDWKLVRRQYDLRLDIHRELLSHHDGRQLSEFSDLLLGISKKAANYSASEHGIGPKVLASNANPDQRLFDLASRFRSLKNASDVPVFIRAAGIKYFQIGVGSEASCMINPDVCWVANTRTIWTDLVIKHADNFKKADDQLKLYRESDLDSEMEYSKWSVLHAELVVPLTRIAEQGEELARFSGVAPGKLKFLWADSIANELYDLHHG
jgi:hypothetical protein